MGRRHGLILACALLAGTQAPATPLLTLAAGEAEFPVDRAAVAAIEISESGGITDVFLRLLPQAADVLDLFTGGAGGAVAVSACGSVLDGAAVHLSEGTGTIYLANTNAERAEALRALWHGRASCDTLDPEVFGHGN
jgi:hypothetical protein